MGGGGGSSPQPGRANLEELFSALLGGGALGYTNPSYLGSKFGGSTQTGGYIGSLPGMGGGSTKGGAEGNVAGGDTGTGPSLASLSATAPGYEQVPLPPPIQAGDLTGGLTPGGQPPPPPGPTGQGNPGGPPGTPGLLPSGLAPFNLGEYIQGILSLPEYAGAIGAGPNAGQLGAAGQQNNLTQAIMQLFGGVTGQSLGGLTRLGNNQQYLPPELQAILNGGLPGQDALTSLAAGRGPGQDILSALASGSDIGQNLLQSVAQSTPDFSSLQALLAQNPSSPASSILQQLAIGSPTAQAQQMLNQLFYQNQGPNASASSALTDIAGAGGAPDYQRVFDAIAKTQQNQLEQQQANLREQFSAGGNRFSTDLANALNQSSDLSNQSLAAKLGELGLSAAAPIAQNRISAAQALGQLGIGGTGTQLAVAQALGNLGLGTGQLNLGAAQGLGSLGQQQYGTQGGLAQALAQLNLGTRGQTGDILNQILGSRTSAAGQAGQLALGAGGQLGTQGTNTANLIGSLFGQNQNLNLQALSQLPQAFQTVSGVPQAAIGQNFNVQSQLQAIADALSKARYGEFTRTQGALLPPVLSFASGSPVIAPTGK